MSRDLAMVLGKGLALRPNLDLAWWRSADLELALRLSRDLALSLQSLLKRPRQTHGISSKKNIRTKAYPKER